MLILGLETSCDETAAAVVQDGTRVRSSIVASQHELHAPYAGVVPEIASRAHLERLLPVLRESLRIGGASFDDLDAVAVGHRPGLIGSLLVGVSAAKALSWRLGVPLIGIDHVAAHLHAGLLDAPPVRWPALGLVVSGGHTSLFLLESARQPRLLGRTLDDAVGEAYDKVATMLGLAHPGGPKVDRLANEGNDRTFDFPIALPQRDNLDFSFSGLKTAVLYTVRGRPAPGASALPPAPPSMAPGRAADIAASFQRAAVAAIVRKVRLALDAFDVPTLLVGGGVSANSRLRRELEELAADRLDLRLPPIQYCLDNAAMIAGAAHARLVDGACDALDLSTSTSSAIA
ncbi:MAG: tRNA (adenosine(37)-N6)-threonylcarbamoyltransferase complex transferase subunit TsaD [Phycisphaerales bacterium]|nr:tRNA (adenosine(37)-N6)-threonylcarbamoyltransferase complex transferase subunit TsaD [Phycisphaerales bacterium]